MGDRIITRKELTNAIKLYNRQGEVASLLARWLGMLDIVEPHKHAAPERPYGATTVAAPSKPPPPELVMDQDSPFWVDREVERAAIAEYNEWVKSQGQPARPGAPRQADDIPEGSRRVRRMKRN